MLYIPDSIASATPRFRLMESLVCLNRRRAVRHFAGAAVLDAAGDVDAERQHLIGIDGQPQPRQGSGTQVPLVTVTEYVSVSPPASTVIVTIKLSSDGRGRLTAEVPLSRTMRTFR